MDYRLEIKPAIPPEQRHKIESLLKSMGYNYHGGGTHTDMTACDITFDDDSQNTVKRPETPQDQRTDLNSYSTIHKSG